MTGAVGAASGSHRPEHDMPTGIVRAPAAVKHAAAGAEVGLQDGTLATVTAGERTGIRDGAPHHHLPSGLTGRPADEAELHEPTGPAFPSGLPAL